MSAHTSGVFLIGDCQGIFSFLYYRFYWSSE
nr:MAG TPA: Toll-like receptor 4-like receptor, PROTEIN RECEPTOR, transmembrane [Caudoviricetes sp.]